MANATARVGKAGVRVNQEFIRHSYVTVSSKTQLYTGAMLGLSSGYLTKFDDTASMKFFGLVRGDNGDPKIPLSADSGTQGDGSLDVDVWQPKRFELSISGVTVADIGRRVYALFDNSGTLDPSATTYANLIGVVVDRVYAMDSGTPVSGVALVEPIYNVPNGPQLQVLSASGAVVIKPSTVIITKSGVAALTIADPATSDNGCTMRFQSSTAQAHTLSNAAGSGFNAGGAASDVGTFGGAIGDGLEITAYGTKWLVNYLRNVTLG